MTTRKCDDVLRKEPNYSRQNTILTNDINTDLKRRKRISPYLLDMLNEPVISDKPVKKCKVARMTGHTTRKYSTKTRDLNSKSHKVITVTRPENRQVSVIQKVEEVQPKLTCKQRRKMRSSLRICLYNKANKGKTLLENKTWVEKITISDRDQVPEAIQQCYIPPPRKQSYERIVPGRVNLNTIDYEIHDNWTKLSDQDVGVKFSKRMTHNSDENALSKLFAEIRKEFSETELERKVREQVKDVTQTLLSTQNATVDRLIKEVVALREELNRANAEVASLKRKLEVIPEVEQQCSVVVPSTTIPTRLLPLKKRIIAEVSRADTTIVSEPEKVNPVIKKVTPKVIVSPKIDVKANVRVDDEKPSTSKQVLIKTNSEVASEIAKVQKPSEIVIKQKSDLTFESRVIPKIKETYTDKDIDMWIDFNLKNEDVRKKEILDSLIEDDKSFASLFDKHASPTQRLNFAKLGCESSRARINAQDINRFTWTKICAKHKTDAERKVECDKIRATLFRTLFFRKQAEFKKLNLGVVNPCLIGVNRWITKLLSLKTAEERIYFRTSWNNKVDAITIRLQNLAKQKC
uniref:Uncharacterized protein n=1 Tax=Riboviria sp. TaxID=2585031 RepID=A0A8K1HHG4_9VIRU|nr:hypothetical protein 1 [Riboviria sp.]